MPTCRINDLDLYYETHGDGPAIVFAHGRGGNHMSWWQQVPVFRDRYRCITFDHRSFGASAEPVEARGETAFVDDLRGLLDHLGIEQAHLVSQSMGGRTCLGFALRHPARTLSLTLGDTTADVSEPALLRAIDAFGPPPTELLPRVLGPRFRREQPVLTFLYAEIEALNHIHGRPAALARRGPKAADLARLRLPVLLITGSDDPIAPPHIVQLLAGMIENAEVEVVPDCGHSVYFEHPDVFNRRLQRFLNQVGEQPRRSVDKWSEL